MKKHSKSASKNQPKLVRIPAKLQFGAVVPDKCKHQAFIEVHKKDIEAVHRTARLALAELGLKFEVLVGYDWEKRNGRA